MADIRHPSAGVSEGTSQTIWEPGTRSGAEQRRLKNWPLEPINLDLPVTTEDFEVGASWPPWRASRRTARLNSYERLYRGDFTDYVDDHNGIRTTANYFGRVAEVMASMMVSEEIDENVQKAAANAIVDMMRYGRSYVARIAGEVVALDPRFCYRHEDGQTLYVVTPFTSTKSQDGGSDYYSIYAIPVEGNAEKWDSSTDIHSATTGQQVESIFGSPEDQESVPDCAWAYADRHPSLGGWGKSAFDDMIPLIFELSKRMSANSYVLDRHMYPLLMLPMAQADVKRILLRDPDHDAPNFDMRDAQNAVRRSLDTNDKLWVPDGVDTSKATYLTWDGQLGASFGQIDLIKAELRMISGLIAALEFEDGAPSGRAIDRMNLPTRWLATMMHNELYEALGKVYMEDFVWDNPMQRSTEEVIPDDPPDGADTTFDGEQRV